MIQEQMTADELVNALKTVLPHAPMRHPRKNRNTYAEGTLKLFRPELKSFAYWIIKQGRSDIDDKSCAAYLDSLPIETDAKTGQPKSVSTENFADRYRVVYSAEFVDAVRAAGAAVAEVLKRPTDFHRDVAEAAESLRPVVAYPNPVGPLTKKARRNLEARLGGTPKPEPKPLADAVRDHLDILRDVRVKLDEAEKELRRLLDEA